LGEPFRYGRKLYPDGPNNYLYCNNNPINHIDPLGLGAEEDNKRFTTGEAVFGQDGSPSFDPMTVEEMGEKVLWGKDRNFVTDMAAGMTPAGIIHDGIDIVHGVNDIRKGDYLSGAIGVFAGTVGLVPVFGDAAKAPLKLARKFLQEGAQKAAKEGGQKVAQETTETAADAIRKGAGEAGPRSTVTDYPEGSFSIRDWEGYPEGVPKPEGPLRLLEGQEYNSARQAANQANRAMHAADPSLAGKQIHEIKPVKFSGSPTDPANKIPLTRPQHTPVTNWWNRLMRDQTGD